MNSRKKSKIGLTLLLIFILAVIVYAALPELPGAIGQTGPVIISTRGGNMDGYKVVTGQDKDNQTLQAEFKNLAEHFEKANKERNSDEKKVSENTKKESTNIANNINSLLIDDAKEADKKGHKKAADLYKCAGENTVFETNVFMKDKIEKDDLDKLKERTEKERKLLNAAYNEVDPSSLTPDQKKYLKDVTYKNILKNLKTIGAISAAVAAIIIDLKKAGGQGTFGAIRALSSGGDKLLLAKSLKSLLDVLTKSLIDSKDNIKRVALI